MMRRLLVLFFCFGSLWANAEQFDHSEFDHLLKKHVHPHNAGHTTQVDYAGVASDRSRLKNYLYHLSEVSRHQFDDWPETAQLAFLINAYNAWTIELILSKYPKVKSIKDLGSFFQSPWAHTFIPLLGKSRSLDDIEHKLIRGSNRYNEPRIHFAVNCASIGCPALKAEAYEGDRLDHQLEQSTQDFLQDRTRNRMTKTSVLEVSSIFKWYRDDFEQGWRGAEGLHQFLALYSPALGLDQKTSDQLKNNELRIAFLDYDWRLNDISAKKRANH